MVEMVQAVWSLASGDAKEASTGMAGDVGVGTAVDELLQLVRYGHTVEPIEVSVIGMPNEATSKD